MILPDDLSPLPVSEGEASCRVEDGGFVSDVVVRQLLVGPMRVDSRVMVPPGGTGEFAGRWDPADDSPFLVMAREEIAAAAEPEAQPMKVAAAPRTRYAVESGFAKAGQGGVGYWLGGMGLAAAVVVSATVLGPFARLETDASAAVPPVEATAP
jgi:hypothetical protein